MEYGEIAVRALLAAVFAVAVYGKVRRRADRAEFVASLRAFDLVPVAFVRPVATVVAVLEAATVGLLAVPSTVLAGYTTGAVLLAGFGGAMVLSIRRGGAPVCRCFGGRGTRVGAVHVWRNAGLVVLALLGAGAHLALDAAAEPAGTALSVFTGLLVATLVVRVDDLVALFTPVSSTRSR